MLARRRDLSTLFWSLGLGVAAVGEGLLFTGFWLVLAYTVSAAGLAALSVVADERRLQIASLLYLVLGTGWALLDQAPPSHLVSEMSPPGGGVPSLLLVVTAVATLAWSLGWDERLRLYAIWTGGALAVYAASISILEAAQRTLVFVGPESRRKATGDGTVLAVGATPGEAYEGVDWGEAWPFHRESMTAYGEQRYADALEAVRGRLEQMPDHAGLHYNYACFATRAGDTGDDTFAHLRRSVERSRGSARTRAETTTSPPYATTRGSSRLFAERAGLDLRRGETKVCPACGYPSGPFPNGGAGDR